VPPEIFFANNQMIRCNNISTFNKEITLQKLFTCWFFQDHIRQMQDFFHDFQHRCPISGLFMAEKSIHDSGFIGTLSYRLSNICILLASNHFLFTRLHNGQVHCCIYSNSNDGNSSYELNLPRRLHSLLTVLHRAVWGQFHCHLATSACQQ